MIVMIIERNNITIISFDPISKLDGEMYVKTKTVNETITIVIPVGRRNQFFFFLFVWLVDLNHFVKITHQGYYLYIDLFLLEVIQHKNLQIFLQIYELLNKLI